MKLVTGVALCVSGFIPLGVASAQQASCSSPDSVASLGAIVGRVMEAETQIPLGFAQVRLRVQGVEAPFEGRSDRAGYFQFCSVPSGTITLTAQIGQFGTFEGPLALGPGQTLTLTMGLTSAPPGGDSGTLTGIVVSSESGEPVEGATILLPILGQTAVSNALGRFTFPSLAPGMVDLQVNRLGYAEAAGRVEIEVGKSIQTRVTLSTEPIALEPITVTATRRRVDLPGLEEFERRYNSGWGRFILEEDIQQRAPLRLTEMLFEAGVGVRSNGEAIYMTRTGCGPLVYLDGIKLTTMSRGGGDLDERQRRALDRLRESGNSPFRSMVAHGDPDLSPEHEAAWAVNLVHPADVAAVEVYRGPAETPGQYIDSNSRCGVILIWTRRGNISGG